MRKPKQETKSFILLPDLIYEFKFMVGFKFILKCRHKGMMMHFLCTLLYDSQSTFYAPLYFIATTKKTYGAVRQALPSPFYIGGNEAQKLTNG